MKKILAIAATAAAAAAAAAASVPTVGMSANPAEDVFTGVTADAGSAGPNPIDQIRPDAPQLAPFGAYDVGVTQRQFVRQDVPDVLGSLDGALVTYDRALDVEIWYPAAAAGVGGTYSTVLRDGETPVELTGRATRDSAPLTGQGAFPLVILSHGYPGNRFLMTPFAENLASKGYVVAAIDHRDSTYSDQAAFSSTLVNRPWDQAFVLEQMSRLEGDLGALTDADNAGIVGYSMGGYGALLFSGAGLSETAVTSRLAPPHDLLMINKAGSDAFAELKDARLKATVAIGPWGRHWDLWDAEGLAGIDIPLMVMAGSVDDVSDYEAGMRPIFAEATGTTRHLLTFEDANHNAAAPMPAPANSWAMSEKLGWAPFEHYADPVWDTVRMNNVAQHFLTAFFDLHLKGEASRAAFLDLVPVAAEGRWDLSEEGTPTADHSHWHGFKNRTAMGLRFETLEQGQ